MSRRIQQGDVLFIEVSKAPDRSCLIDPIDGRFVLQYGEETGHTHSIAAAPGVSLVDRNGTLYLCLGHSGPVIHPEHAPVILPSGVYRVESVIQKAHHLIARPVMGTD
jgi:hypothetical protein